MSFSSQISPCRFSSPFQICIYCGRNAAQHTGAQVETAQY